MAADEKELKLIIKIFKKIVEEPTNSKYQELNHKRLNNKLSNASNLMKILFNAGFYKSEDEKKLLFDANSTDTLKLIYNELC